MGRICDQIYAEEQHLSGAAAGAAAGSWPGTTIFVPLRRLELPPDSGSSLATSDFLRNAGSTLVASRAEVSMKKRPSRSANSFASSAGTARSVPRSALLPTSMMTMFLSACPRAPPASERCGRRTAAWSCRTPASPQQRPCSRRSVLVWNSTPIVALESRLNSFRANLASSCDFPTAESPISTTLNT
ncbi:unnamed protein product [Spirodela intermedia]|uniref:Uncharacterized protein n=1 Tax=Spirodela intermedia TaxID=51605 RepID=A0A7I8JSB9_SPIIN|nr:unnamed protein product [Spirodela intermedia]CAA6672322.1 unnamed protein product [Spirodela intermedia]